MNSNELVEEFLRGIGAKSAQTPERVRILRSLVTGFLELAEFDPDDGDLRVAATVLDELLDAANVFSPWRAHPKLTVFGSARTHRDTPLYDMARDMSGTMAERGWITVSGAGPGIMEASAKGAGKDNTLGVNIELPYEQSSNAYIDAETRLVEMKYFFTRKVAMTKESLAFAIFPGGLGTMDEAFEILTLLHTGKSKPAPVVLLDTLDGSYWEAWLRFITEAVLAGGYIDAPDTCLFRICHSIDDAVGEIETFYANYVSFETSDGRGRVLLHRPPTPEQLARLAETMPKFATGPGFELADDHSISFPFDGRNYVGLRLLINEVNGWVG